MARNFLVEKYDFVTLFTLLFYPGQKKVYLIDMVEYFPNNSLKYSWVMKLGKFLFGKDHLIKFPNYSSNFKKYSELLWKTNAQSLEFLQQYENIFLNTPYEKYLRTQIKDNASYIALKKNILLNVVIKILFYHSIIELQKADIVIFKILPGCSDKLGVKSYLSFKYSNTLISKINSITRTCYSNLSIVFFTFFSPYLVREILTKGFTVKNPTVKKFDFGIHVAHGIHPKGFFGDSTLMDLGNLNYQKTLFIYSIWKFSASDRLKFKKILKNRGASEAEEFKNKIPVSFFINFYLKNYFTGIIFLISFTKKSNKSEFWMLDVIQRILAEYFNHLLFCQYYQVKIFLSRDDYSSRPILRTIVQNSFHLLNVGLQHSAFLYPKYIPQLANTYFDTYYIAGPGYEKLWSPYWGSNKNMMSVGHKADGVIKSALGDSTVHANFLSKYKNKITILFLITAHGDTISPLWLLKNKYAGVHNIFDLDPRIHLILRPRTKEAIASFLFICPELQSFISTGRCTIEYDLFSTQELIAYTDILVAEDASSSLLESLCRKNLFSFYYMVRYSDFEYQNNLVVHNANEFYNMIDSYLKKDENFHLANQAREKLLESFTVRPEGETIQRIGKSFNDLILKL